MVIFELLGPITKIETIARGKEIRTLKSLEATYKPGKWRKLKGLAKIKILGDNAPCVAELHWYELHGFGKRLMKVKRVVRYLKA